MACCFYISSTSALNQVQSQTSPKHSRSNCGDYSLFYISISTINAAHLHWAKYRVKHLRTMCFRNVEYPATRISWHRSYPTLCHFRSVDSFRQYISKRATWVFDCRRGKERCFVPLDHTQVRQSFELSRGEQSRPNSKNFYRWCVFLWLILYSVTKHEFLTAPAKHRIRIRTIPCLQYQRPSSNQYTKDQDRVQYTLHLDARCTPRQATHWCTLHTE